MPKTIALFGLGEAGSLFAVELVSRVSDQAGDAGGTRYIVGHDGGDGASEA